MTLFTTDIALSYLKRWWPRAGHVIDGVPTILVVDGVYDSSALRGCRIDRDDIMEAARRPEGIESVKDIKFAILELSGAIIVIKKQKGSYHCWMPLTRNRSVEPGTLMSVL